MKGHRFIETAKVKIFAGKGGDGCRSFRREKYVPMGGPDGGDGGRGGNIILRADKNTDSLLAFYYRPERRAPDGGHGRGKKMHGRNGADLTLNVPCGTVVNDFETGEQFADLVADGEMFLAARGGKGGMGNCHWLTSTHRAPTEHTPGEAGEARKLKLDLKIVADIGLIGFPNAGKSTLISAISHAHPKIAPYPFTTLYPVIGTVQDGPFSDHEFKVVDIPGLIKNAHAGVGLGHDFLRHVERTRALVFILDMAGTDGRHPADDYLVLRDEIKRYKAELLTRPFVAAANKMDLPESAGLLKEFVRRTGIKPLKISALSGDGIDALKNAMAGLVRRSHAARKRNKVRPETTRMNCNGLDTKNG
ncbi:MAG: GTPase ObgE [Kiritimatiellae bacterium]|nr:GTPase ObgE [Kiritimatiellia bacterium]